MTAGRAVSAILICVFVAATIVAISEGRGPAAVGADADRTQLGTLPGEESRSPVSSPSAASSGPSPSTAPLSKRPLRSVHPSLSSLTPAGLDSLLSRYKGKVVVLDLWASWCPPCREQARTMAKLASDPRRHDVAFIGIATADDPGSAANFVRAHPTPFRSYHDRDGRLARRLKARSLPTTVLIDGQGRTRATLYGALTPESLGASIDALARPPASDQ